MTPSRVNVVPYVGAFATVISARPTMKNKNIRASRVFVPFGAALNSFQIKIPHTAATIVAPWPSEYEIA